MPDKPAAVLTGDVIGSTSIAGSNRKRLLKVMEAATKKATTLLPDFKPEIFQGDSFQGYTLMKIQEALRATLFIILYMRKEGFGIRISTGLGTITFESGKSLTSDGTAFHQSGRNMEILKKKDLLLALSIDNEDLQNEWEVHNTALNFLLNRCTGLQAAALLQMLEKKTQQEAANNLHVKQPAIQQRLQAAGWPVIQSILTRFEMQF
ncbi:MAG: hypothetical protein V4717_13345 [Bacteroidota bacterium]